MVDWIGIAKAGGYIDESGEGDPVKLLTDLYITQNLSLDALTTKLKVSRNAIRSTLVRLEIPTKKRGGANNQKFEVTDALIDRIKEIGVKAVAAELGVSYTTLYKRLYQIMPKPTDAEA